MRTGLWVIALMVSTMAALGEDSKEFRLDPQSPGIDRFLADKEYGDQKLIDSYRILVTGQTKWLDQYGERFDLGDQNGLLVPVADGCQISTGFEYINFGALDSKKTRLIQRYDKDLKKTIPAINLISAPDNTAISFYRGKKPTKNYVWNLVEGKDNMAGRKAALAYILDKCVDNPLPDGDG